MKQTAVKKSKGSKMPLVGLAALAASAYFFLGPDKKKHQRDAKSWAIKMKGDVVEKLETAREMSEPVYHKIIDSVATKYQGKITAGQKEVMELAKDLKKHWKNFNHLAAKPVPVKKTKPALKNKSLKKK